MAEEGMSKPTPILVEATTQNDLTAEAFQDYPSSELNSDFSSSPKMSRDSSWLQVEMCRDFQKDTCPRGDQCRFAHPDSKIVGKNGKITCCYDFLKDRCQRDYCKYYHPPIHIKEKLVNAGKRFGAMMSNATKYPTLPAAGSPALPNYGSSFEAMAGPAMSLCGPAGDCMDRLSICPEFSLGECKVSMCPFAHPGPNVRRNIDQTVTICHDFMRGGCMRGDFCRFFHPSPHHFVNDMVYFGLPPNQSSPLWQQPPLIPILTPPPLLYPVGNGVQPAFFPSHSMASNVPYSLLPSMVQVPVQLAAPSAAASHFIPAQPVVYTPVSIISSTTASTEIETAKM